MTDAGDHWSEGFFDEWYLHVFAFPGPDQSDAEVEGLRRMLSDPPARVLDVACGPGRHGIRLAEMGYRVTGIDSSRLFLALARSEASRRRVDFEAVEGDMRALGYENEFDVVLCLSTSWGFFDDATNDDVLRRMARSVRSDGRLVMQVMNRDWLVANYQPRDWQEVDGYGIVWQERTFDPVRGVNHGSHRWRDPAGGNARRDHTLRVYTATELDTMLRSAGLSPCGWFGDLTGQPFTHRSRWIVVAADRR